MHEGENEVQWLSKCQATPWAHEGLQLPGSYLLSMGFAEERTAEALFQGLEGVCQGCGEREPPWEGSDRLFVVAKLYLGRMIKTIQRDLRSAQRTEVAEAGRYLFPSTS